MANQQILNEVITVTIDNKTGQAQIDVTGSDGQSCMQATSALERVLGGNIKRVLKSEALNRVVRNVRQTLNV